MISEQKAKEYLKDCNSKTDFAEKLGYSYYGGHSARKVNQIFEEYDLDSSDFDKGKKNRKYERVEKECPVCGNKFETKKRHPKERKTCSHSCANSYFNRGNSEEAKKKKSSTLLEKLSINRVELECEWCGDKFEVKKSKSDQNCCSVSCAQKLLWDDKEHKERMIEALGVKDIGIEERKRLRDIGRKGGFGKSGETYFGVKYESLLEKKCFTFLYENNVNFEPHPNIPKSSRVSDVYLPEKDKWIEIDGIDRERLKDNDNLDWYDRWKSKLELYDNLDLEVVVVKSVSDMKNFIAS
jgi:hypothetical protein